MTSILPIGRCQDLIPAFTVDRPFPVVRDPQPVRIDLRTLLGDQAQRSHDKVIGCLRAIRKMMHVLHAIGDEGERLAGNRIDFAQMKSRLNLPAVDLAACIVVRHRLERYARRLRVIMLRLAAQ